jgi:glycosyltransferase involved in cell wall biosynthesis
MKIALLTTDNREHDRDYSTPEPRFGTAPTALLQGFARLPETEIHVISCTQQPLQSPEKIAPNIFYHSLLVPKLGWMRTLYQGCIRATRKKLREIRPDIVHGQGTERDCAVSAVFSGFPNVLTIHGNMKGVAEFYRSRIGSFQWLAAKLETPALGKTGGVLCNSAYTEKLVAPRARRVWRVPNAIRQVFFEPPPRLARGALPILLNVGAVEPRKRQVEILALARRLWQRGLGFELQFAGVTAARTAYGAEFLRQLAAAEKDGYARHLGLLSTNELIAVFDRASALVHFPGEEAFGLVVAEALARNLKFFGAAVGGIVDITTGVEGAELFSETDWPGLENTVAQWLLADCPRPRGAATVMHQRYAPEIIARRHLEIYREVLGGQR